MDQRRFCILVDLPPNTAYWRGVIEGVAAFCRRYPEVGFRLPPGHEPLVEESEAPDGVVTIVTDAESEARARRFGAPVVNVSSVGFGVDLPSVVTDNEAIGRMAAEHLLDQGYAAYACHMESRVAYSVGRFEGFRDRLARAGHAVAAFDSSPEAGSPSEPLELRTATLAWLRRLRKPTGLLTHNDARASGILALCRDGGIGVPEEIGIVGVDDDAFLDESCRPTLTSVDNAPSVVGYRAAEALVAILQGRGAPARVMVPPRGVVQRQSTQPALTDDPLLMQAVRLIRQGERSDVAALVRDIPLSRRSLERRFRLRLGRSPAEEILRVRIERTKAFLADTELPIGTIAEAVGYNQSRNLSTAFRRVVGVEPKAYRALYRL